MKEIISVGAMAGILVGVKAIEYAVGGFSDGTLLARDTQYLFVNPGISVC